LLPRLGRKPKLEMNKLVCLALLGLVAAASASTTATRLREMVGQSGSSSLSSLSSSMSSLSSMPVSSSLSASLGSLSGSSGSVPATSLSSSSSSCDPSPSCNSPTVIQNEALNPEDALRPIDDWLKDFKKRTMGAEGAGDLYAAAKATVSPMIRKLRQNQKDAQQRLAESNANILRHVEEATTQHVYELLKVDREKMDAQDKKQELAAKVLNMKDEEKLRKERDAATLGLASSSVKALEQAVSKKEASSQVVSNIAKILSSQSGSAPESSQIASAIVSAIKSAAASALSSGKF